ncbi:Macrolide export ATP-binding/permease protein MacB [Koleobacter methoxysyntrophicus]|uniref:Macrolide export ATP-binding/permease protein MacB n=2 Tax=Koleobacter methoxysyntrophicus TaxID=2751313 RepID=A0A8A0RID8_9FIRM|nr:FtsX-like permease family protein [Bacillota bacterium]QSQ08045.1 Macrolide export ATP-binding/permease protein MacB [Koleobacter methoxysyntrophicus]
MRQKNIFYSLWIRFCFSAQMAWHGILANPLRSGLTILGVAIGVASVVSLMGIGEGARQAVVEQFKSLGSNVIVIKAHDASVEFKPEDAEELVERVQGLDMATPVINTEAVMRWRRSRGNVNILGVNNQYPEIRDHPLLAGHFFTNWHVLQRSPVAVLGYNIASGLMAGRSPVGQTITLNGRTYRVIGVLSAKGRGNAENIDDMVVIPYTSAMQIAEKKTVVEIWGKAPSPDEADLAVVQLGRIFKRRLGLDQSAPTPVPGGGEGGSPESGAPYKPVEPTKEMKSSKPAIPGSGKDLITITSLNQLVEEADKANRVMTLLLGGIAAVSLLVGGLGIMNIMLVAVTERTEEIGIRRALGAKQGDLLTQFLLEALYLSAIGAIAGTAGGLWGLNLFGRYGFETAVSLQAIKIATIVALTSGLLFGIYPAISASSVMPVKALRRQ